MSRTLVLINEFGEIGLDHDLVTHSSDDVVIEMASGCLCCTIRGNLAKTLREAGDLLGLLQQAPADWFERPTDKDSDTVKIERRVEERFAARSARDYATADQICAELAALGVTVEDHGDGSAWRRTS